MDETMNNTATETLGQAGAENGGGDPKVAAASRNSHVNDNEYVAYAMAMI